MCKHKSTLKCKRTHRHTHSTRFRFQRGIKNKKERKISESRVVFMVVSRDQQSLAELLRGERHSCRKSLRTYASFATAAFQWHWRGSQLFGPVDAAADIKKTHRLYFFFSPRLFFDPPWFAQVQKNVVVALVDNLFIFFFFVFGRCPALMLPNNVALAPQADSTSEFSRKHSAPDQRQVWSAVIRACRSQSHLRRRKRTQKMLLRNDQREQSIPTFDICQDHCQWKEQRQEFRNNYVGSTAGTKKSLVMQLFIYFSSLKQM